MGDTTAPSTTVTTARQAAFASWTSDVLVYIVVLNLFVEFVPSVVIDSFWISILTAVLIKALLVVIVGTEHRIHHMFFEVRDSTIFRAIGMVVTLSVLFLSKFVILETVNFVFGDHVELGHFIEVAALVIAMMGAAALMHAIYDRLGEPASGTST